MAMHVGGGYSTVFDLEYDFSEIQNHILEGPEFPA